MSEGALYAAALAAATAVSLTVAIAASRRRPAPGSLGLALLSFAQAQWSGTLLLQWVLTDHGPSLVWLAIRNVGLFATPVAILVLVADYVGKRTWLTRGRLVTVAVIPVLSYLALLTDPWHGLYLGDVEPTMRFFTPAPVFLLNLVYSYGLILLSAGWLVVHLARRPPYPRQASVLLIAILLPVVHFGIQLAGLDLLHGLNTVPFSFAIAGALEWYALTRLGLFALVPVARDQIIEQIPIGIVVFDADRRIIDVNPAALRMTGASADPIGKTADEAFPGQLATIHRLREGLLQSDHATSSAEFAPGLHVEASASVLRNRAGERIATLVTLRDVTDRLAAERAQRDFIASVAHELQTPLTGLSLLVKTIPRALEDDPASVDGFVARLGTEVERLIHLTDELMTLSRAEVSAVPSVDEPTPVGPVVAETVQALRPIADSKSQTLTVRIPEEAAVTCDAVDLGMMVGNLLSNSIRYTPEGGHISVDARVEGKDGDRLVVLSVADDGIGIPALDAERIFDRFYRVDKARSRSTGGAGLGLSIVKQLAERVGGSVSVQSAPGEGSTFTVRLPAG